MSINVVYGPMASGKTRNAEAFKKHFNAKRVVEWEDVRITPLRNHDLVLTNLHPSEFVVLRGGYPHGNIACHDVFALKKKLGIKP